MNTHIKKIYIKIRCTPNCSCLGALIDSMACSYMRDFMGSVLPICDLEPITSGGSQCC